jgi:hypothetical protein
MDDADSCHGQKRQTGKQSQTLPASILVMTMLPSIHGCSPQPNDDASKTIQFATGTKGEGTDADL